MFAKVSSQGTRRLWDLVQVRKIYCLRLYMTYSKPLFKDASSAICDRANYLMGNEQK